MNRLALGALAWALFGLPAHAQEQVRTTSGVEVRAGWIGSVGDNCTAKAAPDVKPTSIAQNGQIKLMKAIVQTNSVAKCPGIKVPAVVVFYTSSSSFKGVDRFVLGLADGTSRSYTVTVE